MLGLKRGCVALLHHDPEWKREGERTVAELREILGNIAIDVRHVGSTSIPTIPAKPIIDIALAVRDLGDIAPLIEPLKAKGYHLRPDQNTKDQLLLAKGSLYDGRGDLQTHFVHVVCHNSREWQDYLSFRSYLIDHPDTAADYAALKRALAAEHPADRAGYTAAKQDFIARTLAAARELYDRRNNN